MALVAMAPAPRRAIVWDILLGVLIMASGFAALLYLTTETVLLLFGPGACVADTCDYYQYILGLVLALIGPTIAFIPAMVVTVILMVKRRISFWVPLLSLGLAALLWWGGVAIVLANVRVT